MTNTIGLKIACFFCYNLHFQGYIWLSLASCHKDEIWDLWAELGLILDHFSALVPIGTKSQIWDIITSTVLVIWIFSFPRPNFPKPRLLSDTKFFRNRNRDFFSETKFFETETLFPKPNFPKPKPSNIWQKFRNRNVNLWGGVRRLMAKVTKNFHIFFWKYFPHHQADVILLKSDEDQGRCATD